MKQSMRAKRMVRHHKRMANQSKLSLVSLMDIFTILVFFLMFNASDVQVLDNHKSVTLPESVSENVAKETLLILVNNQDISLQGQKLASVPAILAAQEDSIGELAQALKDQLADLNTAPQDPNQQQSQAITIMGDKDVPYQLLKRIMQTCAEQGFTDVALAVEQIVTAQNTSVGSEV